jgi:hypothetical protein
MHLMYNGEDLVLGITLPHWKLKVWKREIAGSRIRVNLNVLLYFAMFSEKDCTTLLRMSWLAVYFVYFEVPVTLGHDAKCLPARFDNFELRLTVDEL